MKGAGATRTSSSAWVFAGIAVAHGVGTLATLAWHVATGRLLGASGYGRLALGMACVLVVAHLAGAGLRQALVRHVPAARVAGGAGVGRLVRWALGVPPAVATALLILGWGLTSTGAVPLPAWVGLGVVASIVVAGLGAGLTGILAGLLQALGAARRGALIGSTLLPLALLASLAPALLAGQREASNLLAWVAAAWGLAGLASAAAVHVSTPAEQRRGTTRPSSQVTTPPMTSPTTPPTTLPTTKGFLTFGMSAMGIGLVYLGLATLDRVMLAGLSTFEEVGLYALPATLTSVLTFVVYLFPPVVGPIFSRWLGSDDPERALGAYRTTCFATALVAVPLALLLAVHGRPVLTAVGGPDYAGGAAVLALLAAGQLSVAATGNNGLLLQLGGHEGVELRMAGLTLGVNAVLNLALIPQLGATGAALATLASLLLSTGIKTLLVHRYWRTWPLGRDGARLLLGAAAFGACQLLPVGGSASGWIVRAAVGLVAYSALAAPWRVVPRLAEVVAASREMGRASLEASDAGRAPA